ncbi:glycosyltransferase family 2 protein [Yoonia sp. R2331]|uniref:glycosyltransferase family 2 protein n=1 Tax=Yoonia sp. R2331 TaxID=3237238 RepID=UPI0034E4A6F1
MPYVSIIVPAYDVASTLPETLGALLAQSFSDFEVLVVDDGSTDETARIAHSFQSDDRVKLISQRNRGLAGARNSGIAAARGGLIAFCDADDTWEPEKLETHVRHLHANPDIGISYAGSAIMDEGSIQLGRHQSPRLRDIRPEHIFKRNPIGNGSAPVMRRAVFDAIAYRPSFETERDWYFDETFRQSEDIECWLRIALTTDWCFEGVDGHLTNYRINASGLSADTDRQLASWENMVSKLRPINPTFFDEHETAARSYQYRYLARRAVSDFDGVRAWNLTLQSLHQSFRPVFEEPIKTIQTAVAAGALRLVGPNALRPFLVAKGAKS